MKKNILIAVTALLLLCCFTQCKKDDDSYSIIGTWVSSDQTDIMQFVDGSTMYRSLSSDSNEPYRYQLSNDSITLQYCGESFVAVPPTTHKYALSRSTLTIDFSNYPGWKKVDYKRIK